MSTYSTADEQIAEQVAESTYEANPHLTVADGFRFGCGFVLSLTAFGLILVIVAATVTLIAMVLGAPVPFGKL